MKYTVCYAMYCSAEVEADSADEAAEKVEPDMSQCDDWEVTTVFDEDQMETVFF